MTMSPNVQCIEPNLAVILDNNELQLFNMVYGASSATGFTNTLLWRDMTGQIIYSWPTNIELQSQINSLVYDGVYFWSVQDQSNIPNYPGWVLRRWVFNDTTFTVDAMMPYKTVTGPARATSVALEHYQFRLLSDMGTDRNWIWVDTSRYSYIMPRLLVGQQIRIGPNSMGDYFWGTIKKLTSSTPYSIIEFEEYPPVSFVGEQPLWSGANNGTPCSVETRLYVFDSSGMLHVINPVDLKTVEQHQDPLYRGVTAADFCIVKNVSAIQVGERTLGLFFVNGMVMYCADVARSLTPTIVQHKSPVYNAATQTWINKVTGQTTTYNVVSAQSLPLNNYDGNSFIPVQELRIRNDNPEDPSSHPQAYLLQRDYRESYDVSYGSWSTYNVVTPIKKLDAQTTFVDLTVTPLVVGSGQIAACMVTVMDDYRRRVENEKVDWGVTTGAGQLLKATEAYTDMNGQNQNTFWAANTTIPFPVYISVTVSGAMSV